VRALTGTDPDRWLAERLRGMTLDLGFAHLRYDDGVEAGIVDVPGHERFLHNMLAGAAGMEALLLVVAANDGPRPQTLEHLAILQYLNVRRVLVVLSKTDLLDAEGLAFARELVRDGLAGTIAADAPIWPVSTVTGAGLGDLRDAIHDALVALPARAPEAPAYLPVDRVFAVAGHGTVVTGTLVQGRIAAGDRMQLVPLGGDAREVRIRSIQVFGDARERAEGGTRVALNLPNVETAELTRGAVVAASQLEPRASFDVTFRPLPGAVALLRRRTPVRAHIGAAEVMGTLVFAAAPVDAEAVPATLHVRRATAAFPGAPFVVRRLSPKSLLGGGKVTGLAPDADVVASATPEVAALVAALRGAGLLGATAERLGAAANVRGDVAEETLARLVDDGRAVRLAKPPAFADGAIVDDCVERALALLGENERAAPWAIGTTLLALARALDVAQSELIRVLAVAAGDGRVAQREGYYATPAFVPDLTPEQRTFFERTFASGTHAPLVPVPAIDVARAIRAATITGLAAAYETLFASRALVKVGENVYRDAQMAEIQARLERELRLHKEVTPATFRDLIGTSRKFAVPLLEWFDAAGVTIRSGDVRFLRLRSLSLRP